MTAPTDQDVESYVVAAAAAIDLPIGAENLSIVIDIVRANAGVAAVFLDFPLNDDAEPAPVFRP
ncbi:MAG: DUF4089 domain-containing protein [Candidatus Eiseniibacteriota bacterium]